MSQNLSPEERFCTICAGCLPEGETCRVCGREEPMLCGFSSEDSIKKNRNKLDTLSTQLKKLTDEQNSEKAWKIINLFVADCNRNSPLMQEQHSNIMEILK